MLLGNSWQTLTTHEKQVAKVRKRIEQLEKANIESDVWTMRGEVIFTSDEIEIKKLRCFMK